jgi:hypothetical protein
LDKYGNKALEEIENQEDYYQVNWDAAYFYNFS